MICDKAFGRGLHTKEIAARDQFCKIAKFFLSFVNLQTMPNLEQTAESDTVSTYQVSTVRVVTDNQLEALIKHSLDRHTCKTYTRSTVVDRLLV